MIHPLSYAGRHALGEGTGGDLHAGSFTWVTDNGVAELGALRLQVSTLLAAPRLKPQGTDHYEDSISCTHGAP